MQGRKMTGKRLLLGTVVVLTGYAVLHIDAGPLDPPGPVAATMHDLGEIGALADLTSLRVFDDQLGSAMDLRSAAYLRMTVDGTDLTGDVVNPPEYAAWSRVIDVDYGVGRDYNEATGAISSHRQHQPLVVRMNLESFFPMIYRAVDLQQIVNQVRLEWTRPDLSSPYYTIVLTNGYVVDATTSLVPTPNGRAHVLDVSFIFDEIELTWEPGSVTAMDSLLLP